MKTRLLLFILLLPGLVRSQEKASESFTVHGSVADISTGLPLAGATLSIVGGRSVVLTDKAGIFSLKVQAGRKRLRCEYIGYRSLDTVVTVSDNQHVDFLLSPSQQTLNQVNIQGTAEPHKDVSTLDVSVLQGNALEQTRGLSLGDALKSVTGVTTFQTGPSIAKPVIHGLTGSRVLILNNGVALEAQQWGQA